MQRFLLVLLVGLTMTAFAANSLLNRIGVARFGMDPIDFATVRIAGGAVMLLLLMSRRLPALSSFAKPRRLLGALSLAIYMFGFSWAYLALDAGIGALILFGTVQIGVFGWAVVSSEAIGARRWSGMLIAMLGLCVLLWPSADATVSLSAAASMVAAGAGWAAYTLFGRSESDALVATGSNFLLCVPLAVAAVVAGGGHQMSVPGVLSALCAGAITSGLGYALWYRVLPELAASLAGVAQLSVPVIAVIGGAFFLAEPITPRLIAAAALVLGGIGLSIVTPGRGRTGPGTGR